MKNIDWIRKLTSRKFWVAVVNFVAMIIVAFGGERDVAVQISALIMAGAGVLGYLLAEGLADSTSIGIGMDVECDVEEPIGSDIEDDGK